MRKEGRGEQRNEENGLIYCGFKKTLLKIRDLSLGVVGVKMVLTGFLHFIVPLNGFQTQEKEIKF